MDRKTLDSFLTARGFQVDGEHDPHHTRNKFRDLYIFGKDWASLSKLRKDLEQAGIPEVALTSITNPDHPDYGKPMVEIRSYWNE